MTNVGTNLFDELQWRGLVYDATEGLAELFATERVTAYIGFDPTASSLHVGIAADRDGRSRGCSGSATRRSRSSAAAPA